MSNYQHELRNEIWYEATKVLIGVVVAQLYYT